CKIHSPKSEVQSAKSKGQITHLGRAMTIPIRQYGELLAKYLRPQWVRVLVLAMLLLGGIALDLVNPQIVRFFIDSASNNGPLSALIGAAAGFLGIALVTQMISVAATYMGENIGWTATNALRGDLALHCLGLDMPFHKT